MYFVFFFSIFILVWEIKYKTHISSLDNNAGAYGEGVYIGNEFGNG